MAQPYEARFTGKHMLMIMFTFFGVIIAVNFTMATMASKSWTGLVVKNSYVASQKFNEELKAAKVQAASGIHSQLEYFDGTLIFVLKDRDGNHLTIENLVAKIGRPAFEQEDRTIAFLPAPDNAHKLLIDLEPGEWAIKITGVSEGNPYRRDARVFVAANGKGLVE